MAKMNDCNVKNNPLIQYSFNKVHNFNSISEFHKTDPKITAHILASRFVFDSSSLQTIKLEKKIIQIALKKKIGQELASARLNTTQFVLNCINPTAFSLLSAFALAKTEEKQKAQKEKRRWANHHKNSNNFALFNKPGTAEQRSSRPRRELKQCFFPQQAYGANHFFDFCVARLNSKNKDTNLKKYNNILSTYKLRTVINAPSCTGPLRSLPQKSLPKTFLPGQIKFLPGFSKFFLRYSLPSLPPLPAKLGGQKPKHKSVFHLCSLAFKDKNKIAKKLSNVEGAYIYKKFKKTSGSVVLKWDQFFGNRLMSACWVLKALIEQISVTDKRSPRPIVNQFINDTNILMKNMGSTCPILGLKITMTGRLGSQKKGMAQQINRSIGKVPLSSFRQNVDYSQSFITTRLGAVGIKIWVCYRDPYPSSFAGPCLRQKDKD